MNMTEEELRLWDMFTCKCLGTSTSPNVENLVKYVYDRADAMIEERRKRISKQETPEVAK